MPNELAKNSNPTRTMSLRMRLTRKILLSPRLGNLAAPANFIFVLGHMRSRSTLLSHILGSSQEVCGYFENHQSYKSKLGLYRLKFDLRDQINPKLKRQTYLDKILHNKHIISPRILNRPNVKAVFLAREPEATLKSMLSMGIRKNLYRFSDEESACDYYCSRLDVLNDYAKLRQGNFFYVDSDELVHHFEDLRFALSQWLGLKHVLKEEYEIFNKTGRAVFGDSSDNIKSGTIQTEQSKHDVEVSPAVLAKAREKYDAHVALLRGMGASLEAKPATNQADEKPLPETANP
ncbi:MAG: hypothetical protein ACQKBV_11865 [Puniceicoccales bacterium]